MSPHPSTLPVLAAARAGYAFLRTHGLALAPVGALAAAAAALANLALPIGAFGVPPPALSAALTPLFFLLSPLAGAAAAAAGIPVPGPGVGLAAFALAVAALIAHRAQGYRLALGAGARPGGLARLLAAYAAVWFFLLIAFVVSGFVLLVAFGAAVSGLGVTPEQLQTLQNAPEQALSLAGQALATPAGMLVRALAILGLVGFVYTLARLAVFAPASLAGDKAMAFSTWAWTRGDGLRIIAAGALVLAPTLMVSLGLGALLAGVFGALVGAGGAVSPAALFAVSFGFALPQALIVTPAMIGLGAFLYQGLRPAKA